MKKSVTKATAKKSVKTPAKGFTAEAVRARAAEKVAKTGFGKDVVEAVKAGEIKRVDAKPPVEPIKVVAAPAAKVEKVPVDRSDAAKRAWVTIRANRAAKAAKAS